MSGTSAPSIFPHRSDPCLRRAEKIHFNQIFFAEDSPSATRSSPPATCSHSPGDETYAESVDGAVYESIGLTYSSTRRSDPRIGLQLLTALGTARTVVNVGAGAGSYEPTDRLVVAVDPSATMRGQRRSDVESGEWTARYGHSLDLEFVDLGYRLVIAEG